MEAGTGAFDIWTASRTSAANPFSSLHAVTELNSASNDIPTFLTPDRCTLYLQSDRPGGVGGYDIYVATKPH